MNNEFERLNELASLHRENVNSYFHESHDVAYEGGQLLSIENELSELDIESWCFLKKEAGKFCVISDKERGWAQLFEKLNEAKGHGFLKSKGYSKISFIPRSNKNGVKTPDLKGERDTSIALCEVKTKSISDYLINSIHNRTVTRPQENITVGLKGSLISIFEEATDQLNSYTKYPNPEKYIYLIIVYDHEVVLDRKKLNVQTRELFNTRKLMGINLVIHDEKKQT